MSQTSSDDLSLSEALAVLRLHCEWGADEALGNSAIDRLITPRSAASNAPAAIIAQRAAPSNSVVGPQAAERSAAAATTLAELDQVLQRADGCGLRDTAGHTVRAQGNPSAFLLLVGEVPDADEDRIGIAFSGASGALLDRMLASIGLARDALLIAPLIPWRPPGGRKVSSIEMAACLPFLHHLIRLVQPEYLILMGQRPARVFFGNDATLSKISGRFHSITVAGMQSKSATLPMRHPSQLLANPAYRREAWADLLRIRQALDARSSQAGEKR